MSPPDSSRLPDGPKAQFDERPNISANGRAAQRLAKTYGFAVFPVRAGAKQPLTSGDKGGPEGQWEPNGNRWGATSSPHRISMYWQRYPDADIGVATGGDLVVIDVDTLNGHGKDGFATLAAHLSLPPTLIASTPTGGKHYYFRTPDSTRVRTRNDGLGPGLDVKGDGGYVVAPSGVGYRPGRRSWVMYRSPAPMDRELLALLQRNDLIVQPRSSLPRPPRDLDDLIEADIGKGLSADPNDTWVDEDPELKLCCALAAIDPDLVYDEWVRVLAGAQNELGDDAFDICDRWSRTGSKYPGPRAFAAKWRDCRKIRGIAIATVYRIADEHDRSWRDDYRRLLGRRRA